MSKIVALFVITTLLVSCSSSVESESIENSNEETNEIIKNDFPSRIERAHQKEKFLAHDAIQFDFHLIFGGRERINGSMTLSTNSYEGVLRKQDNEQLNFVGNQVFYSPNTADSSKVRFDAYTWSYFFLYPYKLNDVGTIWNDYLNDSLNGELYVAEKLTFESGTGDAPDDWYVTYADLESSLIYAAAYIVTLSLIHI